LLVGLNRGQVCLVLVLVGGYGIVKKSPGVAEEIAHGDRRRPVQVRSHHRTGCRSEGGRVIGLGQNCASSKLLETIVEQDLGKYPTGESC